MLSREGDGKGKGGCVQPSWQHIMHYVDKGSELGITNVSSSLYNTGKQRPNQTFLNGLSTCSLRRSKDSSIWPSAAGWGTAVPGGQPELCI